MKIVKIEAAPLHIGMHEAFNVAYGSTTALHNIVVRVLADNGMQGFGEAAPSRMVTGDTVGGIQAAVETQLAPALTGRSVEDFEGNEYILHHCVKGNTGAKAAVDMALYDLRAKILNIPLYQLLGGYRSTLETDLTMSIYDKDKMVSDSLKAVQKGLRILKIKVGTEGMGDVEKVKRIREAVGRDIVLRVDANQGWKPKEAVRIIRRMEDMDLGVELIEQPVKDTDVDGLRMVTSNVYTPVMADESAHNAMDVEKILSTHAADLINIKLMKTGGVYEALKICHLAEIYGVECMVGCMTESRVSISFGAHLAGGKRVITRCDLDSPLMLSDDPVEGGFRYENGGQIVLNQTPGIGITSLPCFKD